MKQKAYNLGAITMPVNERSRAGSPFVGSFPKAGKEWMRTPVQFGSPFSPIKEAQMARPLFPRNLRRAGGAPADPFILPLSLAFLESQRKKQITRERTRQAWDSQTALHMRSAEALLQQKQKELIQINRRAIKPEKRTETPAVVMERIKRIPTVANTEFSHRKREFVNKALFDLGLPVANLTGIAFRENPPGNESILGSAVMGGPEKGTVSLYSRADQLPKIGLLKVLAHELLHTNSPFDPSHDRQYGSKEKREKTAKFAEKLAHQTETTGVFINPYHKQVYQYYMAGLVTDQYWHEENYAISHDMAITNPQKLQDTEFRQHQILDAVGLGSQKIHLTTKTDKQGVQHLSDLDASLMAQTNITKVELMHDHFANIRKKYQPSVKDDSLDFQREKTHNGSRRYRIFIINQERDYPVPIVLVVTRRRVYRLEDAVLKILENFRPGVALDS